MEVHHTCNNRACCNPKHIEVLIHAEHMALHAKTGVWAGSNNSQSKLTENQVLAMRTLDILGLFPKMKLAEAFGVPYRTYFYATSGEGWNHIKLEDFINEHFT